MRMVEDRILISPEEERKTAFVLPKDAKEKPATGKVIKVGPGAYIKGEFVKMMIEEGEVVSYGKYAGNDVEIQDVKYIVLRQPDILVILDEEDLVELEEEEEE